MTASAGETANCCLLLPLKPFVMKLATDRFTLLQTWSSPRFDDPVSSVDTSTVPATGLPSALIVSTLGPANVLGSNAELCCSAARTSVILNDAVPLWLSNYLRVDDIDPRSARTRYLRICRGVHRQRGGHVECGHRLAPRKGGSVFVPRGAWARESCVLTTLVAAPVGTLASLASHHLLTSF